MDTNQDLLNNLIKHFTQEGIRADIQMSKYYEDEYGDDVEEDYPNGAIGDPEGMKLETIGAVYNRVVRYLQEMKK